MKSTRQTRPWFGENKARTIRIIFFFFFFCPVFPLNKNCYIVFIYYNTRQKNKVIQKLTKYEPMNLERCMEKQLLGVTPMAHLFPHTHLHIVTKAAYNHRLTDSKLSTDGPPWKPSLCCGMLLHASDDRWRHCSIYRITVREALQSHIDVTSRSKKRKTLNYT